jgi:hypothetical protein
VVDVGGGNGGLLAAVLADRPDLRGVLLELSSALDSARERLGAAGVADRVELQGGDFFTAVPAGGDVYVLARVLHNWADDAAVRILCRVREAMDGAMDGATDGAARLLVAEEFMPAAGGPGAGARAMVDLLMLVTQEGHDRTAAEYGDLLTAAGFTVVGAGTDVLEAVPT